MKTTLTVTPEAKAQIDALPDYIRLAALLRHLKLIKADQLTIKVKPASQMHPTGIAFNLKLQMRLQMVNYRLEAI